MALTQPNKSIFTVQAPAAFTAGGYTLTNDTNGDYTLANNGIVDIPASKLYNYQQGDEITAARELGINSELIQETIREEAHTNYGNYRTHKQEKLNAIRSESINQWGSKYRRMLSLGLDDDSAKKEANAYARAVYENLKREFRILYPSADNKTEVKSYF